MTSRADISDLRTAIRWHLILMMLAGLQFLTSCQPTGMQESIPMLESPKSSSFLENCHQLKKSDGFRQNVWLCGRQEASVAICMDLDRRLYLVVRSERPARAAYLIDKTYKRLMVTPETLRSRMDTDAFILNGGSTDEKLVGIFRIPENAEESFGIELINHLFNLDLKVQNQTFQWD